MYKSLILINFIYAWICFFILQVSYWILMLFGKIHEAIYLNEVRVKRFRLFSGFANNLLCDFGQSTSQLCASASLCAYSRRILWGKSYPLSICAGLSFAFWALCIKNKYSHIKYFIEQGWKLFLFDGGEPTDSGCKPTPAILSLAPVSEPFQ